MNFNINVKVDMPKSDSAAPVVEDYLRPVALGDAICPYQTDQPKDQKLLQSPWYHNLHSSTSACNCLF